MPELISEAITPEAGTSDTEAMGQGLPGLPRAFTWRGSRYEITAVRSSWKHTQREGGSGENYLRRHYYELSMSDGSTWTVYFLRQTPKSGSPRKRWFLYTLEEAPGQTGPAV